MLEFLKTLAVLKFAVEQRSGDLPWCVLEKKVNEQETVVNEIQARFKEEAYAQTFASTIREDWLMEAKQQTPMGATQNV
jgi:hypothetical protein